MLEYVIIEARRLPQNEVVLTKRIARNQRIGVGRTDLADLVLNDDPEISSVHFLVSVSDDACTITDQNSTNKTFYNGSPITQINIGDGERIRCGKTEFIFRLVSTFDDSPSVVPFIREQPKTVTSVEATPIPSPQGDSAAEADRSADVQRVPSAEPVQPPPSIRTQPAIPASPTRTPAPPVVPAANPHSARTPTDSGDAIDWSLFSEEESSAEHAGQAEITDRRAPISSHVDPLAEEKETLESEKTRVLPGTALGGTIVQVVIAVAGHSDPSARLVIDPRRKAKAVIGRAASSDLPCPLDPTLSKQHFEIEIQDKQCLIRDLNSRNGTSLNGQRILIAPLRHGDRVRAGQTDFEIAIDELG